jgi:hypothetical protein
LIATFDTFHYLEDRLINAFGDFKNAIGLEKSIAGLKRFGAGKNIIQQKLDEFAASGTIPPGYTPDVLVVEKTERHNRFSITLLTVEIISYSSRMNDLHFMPYFYETIGVQEFFIGETEEEMGKIIRGSRLEDGQYQPVTTEDNGYFSEMVASRTPSRVNGVSLGTSSRNGFVSSLRNCFFKCLSLAKFSNLIHRIHIKKIFFTVLAL